MAKTSVIFLELLHGWNRVNSDYNDYIGTIGAQV